MNIDELNQNIEILKDILKESEDTIEEASNEIVKLESGEGDGDIKCLRHLLDRIYTNVSSLKSFIAPIFIEITKLKEKI